MSDAGFRYATADDIVRRYTLISESRGSPPVASSRIAASVIRCARCTIGIPTTVVKGDRSRAGRWVERVICFNCNAPWTPMQVELDSGGVVYDPKRAERRMHLDLDEIMLLTSLVEPRPSGDISRERWHFCVRALIAYLDPRLGTIGRVVEYGEQYHPDQKFWTTKGVRMGIEKAREHITNRADRADVLLKVS